MRVVVAADDNEREQSYDNGRATRDGVIVAAVFAVVLVSVTWVGIAVALRVAGVGRKVDVFGDLQGVYVDVDDVSRARITVWTVRR